MLKNIYSVFIPLLNEFEYIVIPLPVCSGFSVFSSYRRIEIRFSVLKSKNYSFFINYATAFVFKCTKRTHSGRVYKKSYQEVRKYAIGSGFNLL